MQSGKDGFDGRFHVRVRKAEEGAVYAGAVQVKDGTELDLALYTLYAGLKVDGKSPTVTVTKNGIRFTYTAER